MFAQPKVSRVIEVNTESFGSLVFELRRKMYIFCGVPPKIMGETIMGILKYPQVGTLDENLRLLK